MRKEEIWTFFAGCALANIAGENGKIAAEMAARAADELIIQFEKRFSKEQDKQG